MVIDIGDEVRVTPGALQRYGRVAAPSAMSLMMQWCYAHHVGAWPWSVPFSGCV